MKTGLDINKSKPDTDKINGKDYESNFNNFEAKGIDPRANQKPLEFKKEDNKVNFLEDKEDLNGKLPSNNNIDYSNQVERDSKLFEDRSMRENVNF
jgi:hypothetical protein